MKNFKIWVGIIFSFFVKSIWYHPIANKEAKKERTKIRKERIFVPYSTKILSMKKFIPRKSKSPMRKIRFIFPILR